MGHSTGSQNVMHYLSSSINNDPAYHADGGIMQAPISDREVCAKDKPYCDYLSLAEDMVKKGRGHEIMPDEFCKKAGFGGVEMKMTAYRLWSLMGVGSVTLYQLFFIHQICKAKQSVVATMTTSPPTSLSSPPSHTSTPSPPPLVHSPPQR